MASPSGSCSPPSARRRWSAGQPCWSSVPGTWRCSRVSRSGRCPGSWPCSTPSLTRCSTFVTRGRMARADRIALRIPDAYAESVRWRRRRAGRIDGIHPVFLLLGGIAGLVHQVLDGTEARGAEVARAARLSPSATSAALRVLAEHGLAERGRGGWRRGDASLDDVATSTGAADLHRERAERYRRDRESWRARLRAYQGARQPPVSARDGWWSLDDGDEYDEMCRWPVLSDDFVRGPPAGEARERA